MDAVTREVFAVPADDDGLHTCITSTVDLEGAVGGAGITDAARVVGVGSSANAVVPGAVDAEGRQRWMAGLVNVVRECQRVMNRALSRQLGVIAEMVGLGGTEWWGRGIEEVLSRELGLSVSDARDRVAVATALIDRLPGTRAALAAGDIGLPQAKALTELTRDTIAATNVRIEERLSVEWSRNRPDLLRDRVRDVIHREEPDLLPARRRAAAAGRRVWTRPAEDGMATLGVYAPAEQIAMALATLDTAAKAVKRGGDRRGLEAIRADLAVGLLTGPVGPGRGGRVGGNARTGVAGGGGVRARISVVIPFDVLRGRSNLPGYLTGYGPIDADRARELAFDPGSVWHRIITSPLTGYAIHYDTAVYRPPVSLSRHVKARNPRCVFPSCSRPAVACELDHTTRFPEGGTDHDNLGPLCRVHHMMKHHDSGWSIRQAEPGVFVWTDPTGRTYVTTPHQYLDPARQPERHQPDIQPAKQSEDSPDAVIREPRPTPAVPIPSAAA